MSEFATLAAAAKAWPFEQARLVVERLKKSPKETAIFETGYGPSGLPHIGTFGEVVRTSMVRHAFRVLTDDRIASKIICVSDDMDGMRKIPDNIPNADKLVPFMQRPLTDVPDPFGTHESFAHHNNARLRSFLDSFGFEYEFKSATELYKSGAFDQTLLKALSVYDEIMAIMLPTLGEERRRTYSPFLPISPKTGRVLYVPMKRIDAKAGTITFDDEDSEEITQPVTGGRAKMQWKPDFGMRGRPCCTVHLRSLPAEKAFSPAPVRIATQQSGSAPKSFHTRSSSSCAGGWSAFITAGRFMVT